MRRLCRLPGYLLPVEPVTYVAVGLLSSALVLRLLGRFAMERQDVATATHRPRICARSIDESIVPCDLGQPIPCQPITDHWILNIPSQGFTNPNEELVQGTGASGNYGPNNCVILGSLQHVQQHDIVIL